MVTLSAQLAGVIAHAEATGSILDVFAVAKQDDEPVTAKRFVGIAGAPGVAIGNVYVATLSADLRSVPDKPANNIPAELQDFEHALVQVREDIQKVSDSLASRLRTEEQALFEVYLRMLDDNAIPSEVRGKIEAGNWAQGALREVIQSHVRQFSDMEDPYLRERATDIRDLGRRLLSAMQQDGAERVPDFPDNTVLPTSIATSGETICSLTNIVPGKNSPTTIANIGGTAPNQLVRLINAKTPKTAHNIKTKANPVRSLGNATCPVKWNQYHVVSPANAAAKRPILVPSFIFAITQTYRKKTTFHSGI